jgi:hypothetical protein
MHTSRIAHETGSGSEHPSLERLAAFMDARLPKVERAEVMAHLATCPDCFKLFAETARTMRELEPVGERVAYFPVEGRRAVRRALPWAAAAVLVLAAGLAAYRLLWWVPPRIGVASLVEPLRGEPRLAERIWADPQRGSEPPSAAFAVQAFQLGARLVDFQLSVEAGNTAKASDVARRIVIVLEQSGTLYGDLVAHFETARDALRDGRAPTSRFRNLAAKAEYELEDSFSRLYLDFGKWTAAGRLSAVAGSKTFFEQRSNRRFLELLLEDPARLDQDKPAPLEKDVRKELETVRGIWDAGRFAPEDYETIKKSLEAILGHYERMSDPLDFE